MSSEDLSQNSVVMPTAAPVPPTNLPPPQPAPKPSQHILQQQQEQKPTVPSNIPTMNTASGATTNGQMNRKTPASNNNKPVNGSNGSGCNSPDEKKLRPLKIESYVGFDSLPDQFVSRVVRDGFGFNIMALGATGIGKTTLLESLFNTRLNNDASSTRNHASQSVSVNTQQLELNEGSIKLKLTLVESKGFGDQINRTDACKPVVEYIDAQFEKYLQEELKIQRTQNSLADGRIHACLYIISPVGHGLRSLDVVTMKALHTKVNLIPVIGKADTITKTELDTLRAKIDTELKDNGIEYYKFPLDDPDVADVNGKNNGLMPFAVVASNEFIKVGSKHIRARQYPWGTIQVENEAHCDFVRLRDMVIRVNMEDLRDVTHSRHYELYRRVRLGEMGFNTDDESIAVNGSAGAHGTFKENFESRRAAHLDGLARREDEIRLAFVNRVKIREGELKENERELHNRFDRLKREAADEKKRLEMEKAMLEDEMVAFGSTKNAVLGNNTLMHNYGGKADKGKKK